METSEVKNAMKLILATAVLSLAAGTGCSRLGIDWGPRVAVEAEETLTFAGSELRQLDVSTHNGHVTVASNGGGDDLVVHVKKRALAWTIEGAQECMAAIELVTDRVGDRQKLGWRWNPRKKSGWSATVSFDINAPACIGAQINTHNGSVEVTGIAGDCDLETHNGRITVDTGSRKVSAITHNGGIRIAAPVEEIRLESHNGPIHMVLNGERSVSGSVTTHNGRVTIVMNERGAARFVCRTHNGGISSRLDLADVNVSRRRLSGRYGDATGELRVATHNGSITLE